jgi:hypothetical protein
MTENWIVGVLVVLAALYSLWYVLPAAVRQRLGRLHSALGRAPACTTSCGSCGKCPGSTTGSSTQAEAGQPQPITFHRKP